MTKERPIIFSGPMVNAIREGGKTMTRRVVRLTDGQPGTGCVAGLACLAGSRATPLRDGIGLVWSPYGGAPEQPMPADKVGEYSPYGMPGDRLWVRETFKDHTPYLPDLEPDEKVVLYRADDPAPADIRWTPAIHMPRWASRLTLEITEVRVERLQSITEGDAHDEGALGWVSSLDGRAWDLANREWCRWSKRLDPKMGTATARGAFAALWERINGKRPGCSWRDNPWLWVIGFSRVEAS